jgi:putative ABC transport system substrate-binding protein
MRRQSIIVAVVAWLTALLFAPNWAGAQQPSAKIPRVGIIAQAATDKDDPRFDAFRERLHDLGYVEGRNIILEFRFAGCDYSSVPQLAAELLALPIDVIVPAGVGAALPTGRTPIVSPVLMDPVERGFAVSLSRPGGNITGFTLMHAELTSKRLDLLRSAFPQITKVAALVNSNPANLSHKLAFEQTETAARSIGLGNVRTVEAESVAALRALRPQVFTGADAVIVVPDGVF